MRIAQRYAFGWFLVATISAWYLAHDKVLLVEGTVIIDQGPVRGASVHGQARLPRVLTDSQGRFRIPFAANSAYITASKPGYRIASIHSSAHPLVLRLVCWPEKDTEDYAWIDPHPNPGQPNNCANCHVAIYHEWKRSGHAHSAINPKFLHLFAGTDGNSPVQDTWNVQKQHPLGAGVCATCHAPTLHSATLDYDVREAQGVVKSGIHCDYCHKIVDAPADKLGTRFGRDGIQLLRPSEGDLLTFGPLDDAVRRGESFAQLPLYKESRYCASCHEGIVFGVHAYGTYSEWLASPARVQGKQCQDCHMASTGLMSNIAPGKGGIRRDPSSLASHHFPGGQREMLQKCLSMQVCTKVVPQGRQVEVEVVADLVGHRVPTGFVDRHLILTVHATDESGKRVDLLGGPRLPPSAGKWEGNGGMLYAKQLFSENNVAPAPFWLPIFKTQDTRLKPKQPDRRTFLFAAGAKHLTVQLWYRRFWQEVANSRGWNDNDTLVIEKSFRWVDKE